MNHVLETIKSRRSVRKYRTEQIKDVELDKILESAIYAPSGHNDQSWHFTIIQNETVINEISDGAKAVMRTLDIEWIAKMGAIEDLNIFHRAPTAIIVSGKTDAVTPHADCCAAIQNMLLAAESMDIGSCWIGFAKFFFSDPENMKKLDIPKGYEVQYGVALGYKIKENPTALGRKQDVFTYFK